MIYLTDPQYTDIYRVSVGRACVGYAVADPGFLDGGGGACLDKGATGQMAQPSVDEN